MATDAWEKFKANIFKNELVKPGDGVLLAVSGGPDSVCMAHMFWRLAKIMNLDIATVCFNHGLRKEAAREAVFVEKLSEKLGFRCFTVNLLVIKHSKTENVSIETSARQLRYSELIKLAKKLKFNKIATGHNANDNAETMLMWLARGTGITGFCGIPLKRKESGKEIIRPIMVLTRREIMSYIKSQKLKYRIDASNNKLDYTRNKIRHKLVPEFEKLNPLFVEHLYSFSKLLSAENEHFEALAKRFFKQNCVISKNTISLDLKRFFGYNRPLQLRLLKLAIPHRCSISNIERLFDVANGTQKGFKLSAEWQVGKIKNRLIFKRDLK